MVNTKHGLIIYNAAAGAGKTYTLVKDYIVLLLQSHAVDNYKHILAITFTNKAVAEMKSRVLKTLVELSQISLQEEVDDSFLEEIQKETGLSLEIIKQKADKIVKSILHNYASFNIVTIDTFSHRILRTFSKDLGIVTNFEIEMDVDLLIDQAVDRVIETIGLDPDLTKVIVEFALSKLEQDKSWDIAIELRKIGNLLNSEQQLAILKKIEDKNLKDFQKLDLDLKLKANEIKNELKQVSESILNLISKTGLTDTDFIRSSIPKHFKKLSEGDDFFDTKTAWKQNIVETNFYSKNTNSTTKEIIDSIRPTIEKAVIHTQQLLAELDFNYNIRRNLIPLSILKRIYEELTALKKERNLVLISEFNTTIANTIQGQPAPFIYERLGERYRDYFIDEFQDTSTLQWQNLIPLIDNAVATEDENGKRGKITIVGDAKQAIYRWRGGDAEQFIDLTTTKNPFANPNKETIHLPKNYRSYSEIVDFNNQFFTFLAKDFSKAPYQQLYIEGNKQQLNQKKGGYVSIHFIESSSTSEEYEQYAHKTHQTIKELLSKNYVYKDICILVRKRKEGEAIAAYLTDIGFPITSSETLLLKNNSKVIGLINLFYWLINEDNILAKANFLYFLSTHLEVSQTHVFLKEHLTLSKNEISKKLAEQFQKEIDFNHLDTLPLYEALEYTIATLSLAAEAPAYLQSLLDEAFHFTQKKEGGKADFLEYWEQKKDKLSIAIPEGNNAIQIMTIHKSKGLEFPCVIYPFANTDIYEEIQPTLWVPVNSSQFNGFSEVFVDFKKNLAYINDVYREIVNEHQARLELDAFNLLYVALTRAVNELHIISKLDISAKGMPKHNRLSGKFMQFLQFKNSWSRDKMQYDFGINPAKPKEVDTTVASTQFRLDSFLEKENTYSFQISTQSGMLWDSKQEETIQFGKIMHELLAEIYTVDDIDKSIEKLRTWGLFSETIIQRIANQLRQLANHPVLLPYYSLGSLVYNEREFVVENIVYRPDRVVIDESKGEAVIIDYKTGAKSVKNENQINTYATMLSNFNLKVTKKILIYFSHPIEIQYV